VKSAVVSLLAVGVTLLAILAWGYFHPLTTPSCGFGCPASSVSNAPG
jgi:hypothetical protein